MQLRAERATLQHGNQDASVGKATRHAANTQATTRGRTPLTTAQPQPDAPHDPVRGRIRGAITNARRHATTAGILLWAGAGAAYAIHATRTGLPDPTRFAMLESWLIGLGCIGCPLLPLRALARRVRLQAFQAVALVFAALTILLTGLILGGALHYNTLDATFAVILPLAVAIQAVNAADAETHAQRREQASYRAAREDATAAQIDVRYAALANLDRMQAMTVDELAVIIETARGFMDDKQSDQSLTVVPMPTGGARRARAAVNGARRTSV